MPHSDPAADPADQTQYFTAEDVEKARREAIEQARKEERDKLYPQRDKQKEHLETLTAEVTELRKAEAARAKEAERIAREADKAKQAKLDAEKSAKELLAEREQSWQQKLEDLQKAQDAKMAEIAQAQQVQQAYWEKEREVAQLALYARDRVADEKDNIAPELTDLITGNTPEEIDASVEDMKARTARIVEGMRQAQGAARAGMPGIAPSAGATAITPGLDTGGKTLTPEDIKGMSMQEFAALRQQSGMANTGGKGIFG